MIVVRKEANKGSIGKQGIINKRLLNDFSSGENPYKFLCLSNPLYYSLSNDKPFPQGSGDSNCIPHTGEDIGPSSNRSVRMPCVQNRNRLNTFRHFIVNSRLRVIIVSELHAFMRKYLSPEVFWVKRIRKKGGRYYVRLSILKCLSGDYMDFVIKKVSRKYQVRLKEQSLERRYDWIVSREITDTRMLTVFSLNINRRQGRIEELSLLLSRLKPDIICLQETHVRTDMRKTYIPGYITLDIPMHGDGLGMVIGYRKGINISFNVVSSHPDLATFTVNTDGINVWLGNVYRSVTKVETTLATDRRVVKLGKKCERKRTLVMIGDWNQKPSLTVRRLAKENVHVYASFAPTKGTRIVHRKRSNRVIDYAVSNEEGIIMRQSVKERWKISDHLPIVVTLRVKIKDKSPVLLTRFERQLLDNPKIASAVRKHKFVSLTACTSDPKQFFNELKSLLKRLKVVRDEWVSEKQPRFNKTIKRAVIKKRSAERALCNRVGTEEEVARASKNLKKVVRRCKRQAYIKYVARGISYLRKHDARSAWKWVKTHSGLAARSVTAGDIYIPGTNRVETEQPLRLKHWAKHFANLSAKPSKGEYQRRIYRQRNTFAVQTDGTITWAEVSTALKSFRKGKACGVDEIPVEVYKLTENDGNTDIALGLLRILNHVFKYRKIPAEWNDCIVVPIHKKDDRMNPNNYRGISLICTAAKILTKILANRLMSVSIENQLICREQLGFMRNEECLAQAACLLECCQRRRFKDAPTSLLFLDLKKAYDLVPHDALVNRLKRLGIGLRMTRFILELYANTFMRIRVTNDLSERIAYERGVRQGCPMSPILFNLYIDGLLNRLESVPVEGLSNGIKGLMYADDTVIMGSSITDIESKLDIVNDWLKRAGMALNPAKCGIMVIDASITDIDNREISVDNEVIPYVERYTYLGINFNRNLDTNLMAQFRVSKGRGIADCLRLTLSNVYIPLEFKCMLISSVVIPTMTYGAELYGMRITRLAEQKKVLDKCISYILKKVNFCRIRAYEEFDIKPLEVIASLARARAFLKWKNSRGLISELLWTSDRFKSMKKTWSKQTGIWLKSRKIEIGETVTSITEDIVRSRMAYLMREGKSMIGDFAKRANIHSGKAMRCAELSHKGDRRGFQLMTLMRTGSYLFTKHLVSAGNLPLTYRSSCVSCGDNKEEDEFHLLFECKTYEEIRNEYGAKYRWFNTIMHYQHDSKDAITGSLLEGEKDVFKRERVRRFSVIADYFKKLSDKRLRIMRSKTQV